VNFTSWRCQASFFLYILINSLPFIGISPQNYRVLSRFYTPSSGVNEQDADRDARLEAREKRASVAITIVIAMLGFSAILSAVNNLVDGDEVRL
jgi:hypothetical protein